MTAILIILAAVVGFLVGWGCWKNRIGYQIGRRTDMDGGWWKRERTMEAVRLSYTILATVTLAWVIYYGFIKPHQPSCSCRPVKAATPWVIPWIWGGISPDIPPSQAVDSLYQYFLHERGQYE